jgi:hypothetical protein
MLCARRHTAALSSRSLRVATVGVGVVIRPSKSVRVQVATGQGHLLRARVLFVAWRAGLDSHENTTIGVFANRHRPT